MSNNTCIIDNCEGKRYGHGWCQKHYQRWKKHGDPQKLVRLVTNSPAESFAARTKRQGECLVWTGADTDTGYGIIWANGKLTRAHRYAWEQVRGPIPDGLQIDHMCHNRMCCEVTHLRLATVKQNMEHIQGARATNPSKIRGVSWDVSSKKWRVRVKHNYREYYGGMFLDLDDAEAAAIALRTKLFTHNLIDRQAA